MAVSKRLRYEVLRRDNHSCRYCGATAPDVKLTVDHVVPVALGGTDEPSNLVTACAGCNSGKSSTTPNAQQVQDVAQDALRWQRAIAEAGRLQRAGRANLAQYRADFEEQWTAACSRAGWFYDLPTGWEGTIDQFYLAGFTVADLREPLRAAHETYGVKSEWRYFCAVAWRMLADQNELARVLLSVDES